MLNSYCSISDLVSILLSIIGLMLAIWAVIIAMKAEKSLGKVGESLKIATESLLAREDFKLAEHLCNMYSNRMEKIEHKRNTTGKADLEKKYYDHCCQEYGKWLERSQDLAETLSKHKYGFENN